MGVRVAVVSGVADAVEEGIADEDGAVVGVGPESDIEVVAVERAVVVQAEHVPETDDNGTDAGRNAAVPPLPVLALEPGDVEIEQDPELGLELESELVPVPVPVREELQGVHSVLTIPTFSPWTFSV